MIVGSFPGLALLLLSAEVQEVVEVPASTSSVARPDDLFTLLPGQWHIARLLAKGSEPCSSDQCEAGLTSGELVVSVEHSKDFVRIIAGFKTCERTAYSEVHVGSRPGKPTFGRVAKQVERVVKGLARTCNMTAFDVPRLEVAELFPKTHS
jgi:hypothetical protein